ncbi:heat shock protein 26 [Drosophila sechellia]|uniref:GM24881 n=1 Tax=Drosophila sechellia TaxID=7238 RepID=B4HKP1_DROSE|nr:heat shock protein 26 [Drosophila sechellia]EDW40844.1 GM24881 [Drosophila sechellia]
MSLSTLLSLVDELQAPRSPIYELGLGLHPHSRYVLPLGTQQRRSINGCPCASPVCPSSPAGQVLALRGEMANSNDIHWPATAHVGKDGFQVCMDVAQFKPSELNVKVVDDSILVEGKHEERQDDHGHIMRHFVRRYKVPEGYKAEQVVSQLSSDGVLTVSIPKPQAIEDKSKERIIQIQQVGPAHLNVKSNDSEVKGKDGKENGAPNGKDK